MSKPLNITIKLFGTFRKYFNGQEIILDVKESASIGDVRNQLLNKIRQDYPNAKDIDILHQSVFADTHRVLHDTEILMSNTSLAILPPVCGG
jgi:molybdopterin converting factor small subunit